MILSYCRVSTAEQAADGATSLQEQERKNRAIASLRNAGPYDFVNYVDAGVSGSISLGRRPAGAEMLAAATKGDTIVAVKLDRLFRSASDALSTAEMLRKRGIHLILTDMGLEPVTGNGVAKMFFGVLALVAEFERERTAERTNDGRRAKKAKNGYGGGEPPYGFKVEGSGRTAAVVPDREEQDVIKLIEEVREYPGHFRPYRLAQAINEMGLRTRRGTKFQAIQVKRLLDREGVPWTRRWESA